MVIIIIIITAMVVHVPTTIANNDEDENEKEEGENHGDKKSHDNKDKNTNLRTPWSVRVSDFFLAGVALDRDSELDAVTVSVPMSPRPLSWIPVRLIPDGGLPLCQVKKYKNTTVTFEDNGTREERPSLICTFLFLCIYFFEDPKTHKRFKRTLFNQKKVRMQSLEDILFFKLCTI